MELVILDYCKVCIAIFVSLISLYNGSLQILLMIIIILILHLLLDKIHQNINFWMYGIMLSC
jgi:hypothetical protein